MLKQSLNKGPFWGPCSAELRQRDMPAHLAKLRQRDMPARPALTACDLGQEHDSWQRDGRQCRCRSAFVLLAMIVVQIVAFDFENRPFHSTIFSIALSGIAAASGDWGLSLSIESFCESRILGALRESSPEACIENHVSSGLGIAGVACALAHMGESLIVGNRGQHVACDAVS